MDVSCQGIQSYVTYEPDQGSLVIYLSNEGSIDTDFEITDNVYESFLPQTTLVAQGSSSTISFDISNAGYWYDVSISVSSCYLRRSMGRMETNKDSISDPAMSAGLPGLWSGVSNTGIHTYIHTYKHANIFIRTQLHTFTLHAHVRGIKVYIYIYIYVYIHTYLLSCICSWCKDQVSNFASFFKNNQERRNQICFH